MSPRAAFIASSKSLFIIQPSKMADVYQETDHGLFWIMDDEEHRLSILSL